MFLALVYSGPDDKGVANQSAVGPVLSPTTPVVATHALCRLGRENCGRRTPPIGGNSALTPVWARNTMMVDRATPLIDGGDVKNSKLGLYLLDVR